MNNFNMMKQMQQMQAKLMAAQNKISEMEVIGVAGGGAISTTIDGNGNMIKIHIDKSVISPDDSSMLEDLIIAAYTDARAQLEKKVQQENPFSGIMPAGMKLPF